MNRIRARVGPLWPYVVLIAIPAAGFILPDLIGGHLLMTGDNLQQNYPLHVLTGSMVRHGQLPLWDQYIFSGSPLLAGFNAGAFYPLVSFFVLLPDRAAWIATEVVLFSAIGIGMYVFLRDLALSTTACLLGALTFTFAGTVFSQVNHVDMTEGFVAIPWMLLAVRHIIADAQWRWAVVLGVGFALVILGGAPEAMLDEAWMVVLFAAFSAGFSRSNWWRVISRGAAGAALALSLAAVQWLPGLDAIANSQRSGFGSGFAASGSYPPTDILTSLVPYLYGGYGHLGESMFFSAYNLPEVGIYLGILPVIAMLVMWIPRWPSRLSSRDRLTWYLLGTVGLLLALGVNTPLEHFFNAVPLYGHQRLQSRNMITVSVALCVLFAGWIDRDRSLATNETRRVPRDEPALGSELWVDGADDHSGKDRWLWVDRISALVPFAVVLATLVVAFANPNWLIHSFTGADPSSSTVHTVREASIIALGVCAAAAAVVWLRSVLAVRLWIPLMAVFVVADLGFVVGTSQLVTPAPNDLVAGTTTVENYIAAHLAPGGRFIVYDPQNFSEAPQGSTGLPDDNILAGLPSVAGYSSIVNQTYNDATSTHTVGELDLDSLASGRLDDLDLVDILTSPEYFLLPLSSTPSSLADVQTESESGGTDPVLPDGAKDGYVDNVYPYIPAPRAPLKAGERGTWFFGESLQPTRASLLFAKAAPASSVRFGILQPNGVTQWGPSVITPAGATRVTGALPVGGGPGNGLVVQVLAGRIPAHQATISVDGRPYELDGALSAALHPSEWHQVGAVEGHPLFVRNRAPSPLHAVGGGAARAPAITVLSSTANVERVRVEAQHPVDLVRNVAWDNGWSASASVNGGPERSVPMSAYGLVQQVHLPAGDVKVTFRYRPAHFAVSVALSVGAVIFLIGLLVVVVVRRRRDRGTRAPSPPLG